MNKLFSKIIGASLAIAMMIGVGAGLNAAKQAKEVNAVTNTVSYEVGNSGTVFGGVISSVNGTSTGTVQLTDGADTSFDLVGVCTLKSVKSGKSDYRGTSSGYIQIGSGNANVKLVLTVSGISENISSVDIFAYGSNHKMTVKVDATSYYSQNLPGTAPSNAINIQPNATGTLEITYEASSAKALYFKSISVTYGEAAAENTHPVSFESNGGSAVLTQNVVHGETAEEPENPNKRGYVFGGWYKEGMVEEYNFNDPVEDGITLYAKWDKPALAESYSPSMADGDYHIAGKITAITGSNQFFIQSGENALCVAGGNFMNSLHKGDNVDLFGAYVNSGKIMNNLAYCDIVSTSYSATPIDTISNVNEANLCKYIWINHPFQLNSGFVGKKATIRNSDLIVFYNSLSCVDDGSFDPADYVADDYIVCEGVIFKLENTLGLYITHIEKPTQHVVTFDYNDGRGTYLTQRVLDNDHVVRPADPTKDSDEMYNYSFYGWYLNQACTQPFDFNGVISSSFPVYAKWDRVQRDASEVVEGTLKTNASLSYTDYAQTGFGAKDTLDNANTINANTTNYSAWTNDDSTSGVVYNGFTAGQNTTIQLRTKNSNEGIVTTANANDYRAATITLTWYSSTASGRSVDIYGKNTAYAEPSDLFDDDTDGTLIGSLSFNDADENNQTTLTVTGDFTFIGLRSNDSPLYLSSIDIQWGDEIDYDYTNLKIKFSSKISEELWTRLNNESTITGYGMLLTTSNAIGNDHISDHYASSENYQSSPNVKSKVVNFPNTKATPNLSEGNYGWSLHKNIPEADYKTVFIAVSYIITEDDGVLFMDEIRATAKDLAGSLIQEGTYAEDAFGGSLKFLADC